MKKVNKLAISLLAIASTGVVFARSMALSVQGVDPVSFAIDGVATSYKTVRFYTAYSGSAWGSATNVQVEDGGKVAIGSIPTPSASGYAFKGWTTTAPSGTNYTAEKSSSEVANTTVSADIVYYPILESTSDYVTLGDDDATYYAANVDVVLNTDTIGATKLGRRYVGFDGIPNPSATWNDSRTIHTTSGIYKFVNEGGGAQLYRKIGFHPEANWASDWNGTPTYFLHSWKSGSSNITVRLGDSLDSNGNIFGYLVAEYKDFLFVRNGHGATSIDWGSGDRQSGDISLDVACTGAKGSYSSQYYTKSSIVLGMTENWWSAWSEPEVGWGS